MSNTSVSNEYMVVFVTLLNGVTYGVFNPIIKNEMSFHGVTARWVSKLFNYNKKAERVYTARFVRTCGRLPTMRYGCIIRHQYTSLLAWRDEEKAKSYQSQKSHLSTQLLTTVFWD